MNEDVVTAESLLKRIQDIRTDLTDSRLDPAITKTQELKVTMIPLWKPDSPVEIQRDLDQALATLKDMKDRHQTFAPSWVAQFLVITERDRAPGRADCHAMQVNVDSTVP